MLLARGARVVEERLGRSGLAVHGKQLGQLHGERHAVLECRDRVELLQQRPSAHPVAAGRKRFGKAGRRCLDERRVPQREGFVLRLPEDGFCLRNALQPEKVPAQVIEREGVVVRQPTGLE